MRKLGLDFGDKRIGVAVSDKMGWTAQSKGVINRVNLTEDLVELKEYINKYSIEEIINYI